MKELLFITAILGILHSCGDLKKNEELWILEVDML